MATPSAVSTAVTEWDEQGNPLSATPYTSAPAQSTNATVEWDENGNPIQPAQPGLLSRAYSTGVAAPVVDLAKQIYQSRANDIAQVAEYFDKGDYNHALTAAVKVLPFVDQGSPEQKVLQHIATSSVDESKQAINSNTYKDFAIHAAGAIAPPFAPSVKAAIEDAQNKNYSGLVGMR